MWTTIDGFEGLYEISDTGKIRNCITKKLLKGNLNSYGYRVVRLRKDGKNYDLKLHRLLAIAFIPNPNDFPCVNHIDGNKDNNSLDNLEWCTYAYNNSHAREQLSLDFSEKSVLQRTLNGDYVAIWRNASLAAKSVNGNSTTIANCCRGTQSVAYDYRWNYIDFDFRATLRL